MRDLCSHINVPNNMYAHLCELWEAPIEEQKIHIWTLVLFGFLVKGT